jgi:hypothetical protein
MEAVHYGQAFDDYNFDYNVAADVNKILDSGSQTDSLDEVEEKYGTAVKQLAGISYHLGLPFQNNYKVGFETEGKGYQEGMPSLPRIVVQLKSGEGMSENDAQRLAKRYENEIAAKASADNFKLRAVPQEMKDIKSGFGGYVVIIEVYNA